MSMPAPKCYALQPAAYRERVPGPARSAGAGTTHNKRASTLGNQDMSKGQSLQDPFLNVLRREHVPVAVYLVNGIKLQGTIESFDQFVVLLRNQVSQMVYKHAISTVVPSRNVKISNGDMPAEHEAEEPSSSAPVETGE